MEPEASVLSDDNNSVTIPANYVDVTVNEHYVVGNGASYDKHVYSICVTVEGLQYTVDRTYVDFVDLDRKIRKKYPRIRIPTLPLEASAFIAKVLAKEAPKVVKKQRQSIVSSSPSREKSSVALTRESITAFTKDGALSQLSKSLKLVDVVGDKVGVLDKYLKALMSMHELLASDEILLFLDEEATSMSIDPTSLEPISAHDLLLLLSSPTNSVSVSRIEDATFPVRTGQLVVWRFSTEKYDIGFSVEMCGEVKVSYTRYNSHARPVFGTVEASGSGICRLVWDNSYAKFRSKQLHWCARVVSAEEYHTAKLQALEVQREKKKFMNQRLTLKRVCVRNAAAFSGVIHSMSVVHDHAEEEDMHIREMEDEITRLQNEVDDLRSEVESLQADIEDVEVLKAAAEESRDQISGSWRFTVNQLEAAQSELKSTRKEISELTTQKSEQKLEIDRYQRLNENNSNEILKLREEVKVLKEQLRDSEEAERAANSECLAALEKADSEIASLEQQVNSIKSDFQLERQQIETEWEESLNVVTQDKSNLQSMVEELQLELSETKALHKIELDRIVDECVIHKNAVIGLTAELNVFKSSNERLKIQVSELEHQVAQHALAAAAAAAAAPTTSDTDVTTRNSINSNSDSNLAKSPDTIPESADADITVLLHQLESERRSSEAWQEEADTLRVANLKQANELLAHKEKIHSLTLANEQQKQQETHEMHRLNEIVSQLTAHLEQLNSDKVFTEMNFEMISQEKVLIAAELENKSQLFGMELDRINSDYLLLQSEFEGTKTEFQQNTSALLEKVGELENLLTISENNCKEINSKYSSIISKQESLSAENEELVTQLKENIIILQTEKNEAIESHKIAEKLLLEELRDSKDRIQQLVSQVQLINSDSSSNLSELKQKVCQLQDSNKILVDDCEERIKIITDAYENKLRSLGEENELQLNIRLNQQKDLLLEEFHNEKENMKSELNELLTNQLLEARQLIRVELEKEVKLQKDQQEHQEHQQQVLMQQQQQQQQQIPITPQRQPNSSLSSLFEQLTSNSPLLMHSASASLMQGTPSSTNPEVIKLSTLLRAKEEQLNITMRLYDEQSEHVANLTAEVSELRSQLEARSNMSQEDELKMYKLQSAMSEISAAIAFWSN